jgi:hypothetical protein
MSLLSDLDALAKDPEFQKKIKVAVVNAATNISSEAPTEGYQKYHDKRSSYSQQILNAPANFVEPFAYSCASRQTLSMDSSDQDIQFTVNSVFDAMAGVTYSEKPVVENP